MSSSLPPDKGKPDNPFEKNPYQSPLSEQGIEPGQYDYLEPNRGSTVMTLGLTSLMMFGIGIACCLATTFIGAPLGVAAWLMGKTDLAKMNQGRMDAAGRQQTRSGQVLGLIGAVLCGLACLFQIAIIVILIVGLATSP